MAATVNVADAGAMTVSLTGWAVITGATIDGLTVNVAALLVAAGDTPLEATTSYWFPLRDAVVNVIVYVALVAPLIGVKIKPPSVLTSH